MYCFRDPGDLSYTGQYTDVPLQLEVYHYDQEGWEHRSFSAIEELGELSRDGVNWINLIGLNHPQAIDTLGALVGLHELHREDIVHVSRHSKVELQPAYLLSNHYVLHSRGSSIDREVISLLLSKNMVISFQEKPGDVFEDVRGDIRETGSHIREQGADYLYYSLVDRIIDEASKLLRDLSFQLDDLEEQMMDNTDFDMKQVYTIKKELHSLKIAIYPLDALYDLLRSEKNRVLGPGVLPYMKDVEDHIGQIMADIGRTQDVIENMSDNHMMRLSNDMNQVMKILTVFSAIFIPLNFITGMYGMNFRYMPGLDHPLAFPFFLMATTVIVLGLIFFIKSKKWF